MLEFLKDVDWAGIIALVPYAILWIGTEIALKLDEKKSRRKRRNGKNSRKWKL